MATLISAKGFMGTSFQELWRVSLRIVGIRFDTSLDISKIYI